MGYAEKVTALRAVQMVTAGMEGEEALEVGGEGVFTANFIRAIRGAADGDGDGLVTASEIGAYLGPAVTNSTSGKQTPQFGSLEGEGEVLFKWEK